MENLDTIDLDLVSGSGGKELAGGYALIELFYDERGSFSEGFKQGSHSVKITYGNAGEGNGLPNA